MKHDIYVFDPSVVDKRCDVCKWHRILVVSHFPNGSALVHSRIHLVSPDGGTGGYIDAIHSFLYDGKPLCMESYKKIGGK